MTTPYDTTDYEVSQVDWSAKTYIGKKDTVSFDAISGFFTDHLGKIYEQVQSGGLEVTGQPVGLYWHWDMENMRTAMAAALPVGEIAEFEEYEVIIVPTGRAVAVDYYGPYEEMMNAHDAIDAYIAEHAMGAPTVIVEEYVTDPATEPDPSKWLTRIMYVYAGD